MMRRLLRAAAIVGVLAVTAGVVARATAPQPTLQAVADLAGDAMTALAAFAHRVRATVSHLTAAQLMEGAVVAWFLFVLALVLLARSKRAESPEETQAETPPAATVRAATSAHQTPTPAATTHSLIPPVPGTQAPEKEPVSFLDVLEDTPHGRSLRGSAVAPPVSNPLTERGIESEQQHEDLSGIQSGRNGRSSRRPRRSRGHVMALTGISRTDERLLPYGLFIVAEDEGVPSSGSTASQRTVEVIAEQVAPSLANEHVLGSVQLAALLKTAVLRASIELRQQCIRTAMDLGAAVTVVMVMGDMVYVVSVGDCRTYMFRPGERLLQITTDHAVISGLMETGLLQPEALPQRRDSIYRSIGGGQAAAQVDTFEVRVRPDDLLLLCSPGLGQALRVPHIEAILRADAEPRSAAEVLAREGSRRARESDFSVIVVRPLGDWMPQFGISTAEVGIA
jgi:serine/threonine protein phosphatase PrpC